VYVSPVVGSIIGLIVGALAKFIMPGKDPGGIFITMLIGIAGALLATLSAAKWVYTRRASAASSCRWWVQSSSWPSTACSKANPPPPRERV